MATRTILRDDSIDKESCYVCDCGFGKQLSETCDCEKCLSYKLPLKKCPWCGTKFEVINMTKENVA